MREAVAKAAPELLALSHRIHANPEVAWEEEKAARWTAYALDDLGYDVVTGTAGLPTAFTATVGSGPLHLAICAEYDALPGLGHACGHNVIAAAAVGAAAGLAPVADELGLKVTVFGTPAEEGGGGKILMLERGAFDGVHAAMMVHPGPADVAEADPYAVAHLKVRYHGKAAHAAAYPEQGPQRGGRLHGRPGRHRTPAPAAPVHHARARHGDARRGGPERDPGADRGPLVRARGKS
ncbi:M20/M25/M40 family metallo-hydrolase [Streptomyces aureus]